MKNTGIEMSLKQIASRAWSERTTPNVYKTAKQLTDGSYGGKEEARNYTTNTQRVKSIVDYVADQNRKAGPLDPTHVESFRTSPPYDADDAVLAAATLCLAVGIRCRVIGARYGQSWTCWLAYQDEGQWITINVFEGRLVGSDRKPDEQIVVECQMPYTADPGTESEGSAEGDIDGTCLMLGTVMQAVEAKKQDPDNVAWLANLVYKALNAHRAAFGAPDLVRPPNPAHGHAIAVLFADGKDVVIRFEEQEIK
jgi:hypothetical protein